MISLDSVDRLYYQPCALCPQPEIIWADGPGDAPCTHDSIKYWKAPQFLSWLYNESPVRNITVVNSRWGTPVVGDYMTGSDRWGHSLIHTQTGLGMRLVGKKYYPVKISMYMLSC